MATLYKPNQLEGSEVFPSNGKTWTLKELYDMLHTDIVEIVRSRDSGYILIVDENGKLRKNPIVNYAATMKARTAPWDHIVGYALYCPVEEFE